MKKRFSTMILALALCLGLAVPALAAEGGAYSGDITCDFDDPNLAIEDIGPTGVCLVREQIRDEYKNVGLAVYVKASYGDPSLEKNSNMPAPVHTLPQGTRFTWTGLRPEDNMMLYVYPDMDGDGIYDWMSMCYDEEKGYYSFFSVDEKSGYLTFPESGEPVDFAHINNGSGANGIFGTVAELPKVLGLGCEKTQDESGLTSITIDSDSVYELFGCNTLFTWQISRGKGSEGRHVRAAVMVSRDGSTPGIVFEFTDTPEWCAEEAKWAALRGITKGYGGKDKFAPGVNCSQAEILTFLWRAENKPAAGSKSPFTVASYYQDAVDWAYGKGIIGGGFNPGAPCTRAQAVTYIWKARNELEAKETASFSDVDAGSPIAPAVSWAVENGVTKGYGGADTFAPGRVCSRGEIACFLYRAYN